MSSDYLHARTRAKTGKLDVVARFHRNELADGEEAVDLSLDF